MLTCDNCGSECKSTVSNEFIRTHFRFGWPPWEKEIVEEHWCRRCHYADHPGSNAVSAAKRRKYDFADDHRHSDSNENRT